MLPIETIIHKGDEFANEIRVTSVWDTAHRIYGFGSNDLLVAQGLSNQTTHLFGGGGDDVLRATELGKHRWGGDNILDGGAGADTMIGGINNETFYVSQVRDVVRDESTSDRDSVYTTISRFRLPDNVEVLVYLGDSDFRGHGNAQANTLYGRQGNDLLRGNAGDDWLSGGTTGSDTLVGGMGADVFGGGSSENTVTIQYARTAESRGRLGTDTVYGMDPQDRIDLSLIDADASTPGRNEAFTFIGDTQFSADATGQVRLEELSSGRVMLHVSTDADAVAEMRIIFSGIPDFTDASFIL